MLTPKGLRSPHQKTSGEVAECSALVAARPHPPTTTTHQKPQQQSSNHVQEPTRRSLAPTSYAACLETNPSAAQTAGCLLPEQCENQAVASTQSALVAGLSSLVKALSVKMLALLNQGERLLPGAFHERHPTNEPETPARVASVRRRRMDESQPPEEWHWTPPTMRSGADCNPQRSAADDVRVSL